MSMMSIRKKDKDDYNEYLYVHFIGGYFAVWTALSMLAASKRESGRVGVSCPMRMGMNTLVRVMGL